MVAIALSLRVCPCVRPYSTRSKPCPRTGFRGKAGAAISRDQVRGHVPGPRAPTTQRLTPSAQTRNLPCQERRLEVRMRRQSKASATALPVRGRASLLILALALSAAALAVSPARAGGQAGYGCSPGFDLGALTFEQGVALPRIDAGLKAGVFDMAGLAGGFHKGDQHDGDLVCFKEVGALSGDVGVWGDRYNILDNKAPN